MSIVLSIYSQKGFREVALPERGQSELEVVIRREVFGLDKDLTLALEKRGEGWTLSPGGGTLLLNGKRQKSADIIGGMQLELDLGGRRITVISFERTNPFTAYRKYGLAGLQQIRIGWNENNDICYQDHPEEGQHYVSGSHCVLSLKNGRWELRDTSTNGTYLNFQRVHGNTILQYGDSIRIMRLNIIFLGDMIAVDECEGLRVKIPRVQRGAEERLAIPPRSSSGQILFHRSPRNLRQLYTDPIEIEEPPRPQEVQDQPLAMQVGPALTMAIPMMLGSGISMLGNNSGSTPMMYMGLVTALSSAVIGSFWAVANVRYTSKARRQAENRRFESYSEYLIRMRDQIELRYKENSQAMRERYQSADECCALDQRSPLLWNRNASYEDFLAVRLGMGDIPFQAPIEIPKKRFTLINDSLADKPRMLQENFRMLKDVPVTVDLLKNRLVGVAGGDSRRTAIETAQAMIAQIAAANCYTDVKLAIVCDSSSDLDQTVWDFALWLPHVWSGDKKIRYMATNRAERGEVFYALTQILRNRKEEQEKDRTLKPRIVLFVSDPTLLDGEAISHYVFSRGEDLGLSTVLLADRASDLPNECECVIECGGQFQGIYDTRSGREHGTAIKFDKTAREKLWQFAKNLGRITVVDSEQEGEIPNALTFFDMYGVSRPQELDAATRWKKSDVVSSMRALVGFRSGNTPCYLDINEKYHGPHGLVAGTTGSGKSETLQTYILSLAVNYSPEDVGFFIIDYKGGGMANLFDNLPHMIGSISNLSGNQVKRAMVSIQSENRRRQRIFTEYGVNNINGYTKLYKSGDATEPVPHLFIIVDEFAELKREEPEFMKELISVAQVGRSLGVHMILSTQRPSGTVDENIWANSKFRLCLRVQDRQDSMDMLHRVEAAYLTQAGRCYLQVGNDEIFELFQSGWSGASYDAEAGGSLLIAQMLSVTGKVDLAGNRTKVKRKEAARLRWVNQLLDALQKAEAETGVSVAEAGFSIEERTDFRDAFYRFIHEVQPEFEESPFNNARLQDFIELYKAAKDAGADRAARIISGASGGNYRLPEVRSKTQLEVVADYLMDVKEHLGLKEIRKLWMPVLPENLYLDGMETYRRTAFNGTAWPERPKRFHLSAVIGMADDPANQAQFPVSLDFARGGHHLLIGTVSTGKSTFLQSAVYSLAASYSPDLLNIYCLDFSAKMLSVFADLKHVGGYLEEGDLETDAVSKFFNLMTRILDERKVRFAGTSFEDAMNHDGWTMPAVLIVLDNYGSFREKTDDAYEAVLSRIIKEGNAYGVYLLVTAGGVGMQEMPNRLAENFRTGLALELPDPFAYGDVLHCMKPDVLPEARVKGRGLLDHEGRILEFQTALATPAKDGTIGVEAQPDKDAVPVEAPERNDRIKLAVERMNAAWTGPRARMIPRIPEKPTRKEFTELEDYRAALADRSLLPIGYNFADASVYTLDLRKFYTYLVLGTRQSGKTVFMQNVMRTCAERGEEVHIIELHSHTYEQTAHENGWKRYGDADSLTDFFIWLHGECEKRNQIRKECREQGVPQEQYFDRAQANTRLNIFIADPLALSQELSRLDDSPAPAVETENSGKDAGKNKAKNAAATNGGKKKAAEKAAADQKPRFSAEQQMSFLSSLCERGQALNIFFYTEVSDRDLSENLISYRWFENVAAYQSGIRFGGRLDKQNILPFANVSYREQDRSMPQGVGLIPSDRQEEKSVRVVVPMI